MAGVVVMSGSVLLVPSAVRAATWAREVRFPAAGSTGDPELMWSEPLADANPPCDAENQVHSPYTGYTSEYLHPNAFDMNDATFWYTGSTSAPGMEIVFRGDDDWIGQPKTHFRILSGNSATMSLWYYDDSVGVDEWLEVTSFGGTSTSGAPYDTGMVDIRPGAGKIIDNPIPDDATCFKVVTEGGQDSAYGWSVGEIGLYSSEEPEDSTGCEGTGDLAWGADGLTSDSHDQWGDVFVGSMATCIFTQPGIYYYDPPEGIVEGATYQVAIQFSTFNGGRARAEALWKICESVVPGSLSIGLLQSVTSDIDILDSEIMTVDAPEDACGFVFVFNDDVFLQGVLVSNVDGDPVLDGEGDHPPTWGNGGIDPSDEFGEALDDCNPPEDFIDVPGWLNYGACLVSVGFTFTIDGIASIPGELASLIAGAFGGVATTIGGVLATALGGLADLFVTGMSTILEFLFVPSTLGGGWADFMEDAQVRVPFGWFAQIEGSVAAGFDSGPGSLPAMVLSIGAADVDVGFGGALDAVAPYRSLILGGVALLMSLSALHWLMAGVGVAPQAGGDKS